MGTVFENSEMEIYHYDDKDEFILFSTKGENKDQYYVATFTREQLKELVNTLKKSLEENNYV